jgi:hypothetical protein
MDNFILISHYENKLSPISETLTWCSFNSAKKFETLEQAEEFYQTIPMDMAGYFSIGKILPKEVIIDLHYYWIREGDYIVLTKNKEVVKKIYQKIHMIEPDEHTKKLMLEFAEKGIGLFESFMKGIGKK